MARTKQATPVKRAASSDWIDHRQVALDPVAGTRPKDRVPVENGAFNGHVKEVVAQVDSKPAGLTELIICVAGIYTSFLTWAFLQERITTTQYGPASNPEIFHYPILLNTIQSAFAALVGYVYLVASTGGLTHCPPIFPSHAALGPLLLVSVTSSLASPFGYASLKYVGYVTFILAKSCKLLPVMALHVSVFRKSYPPYKYAIVALITAGVAIFTLQHPSSSKKASKTAVVPGDTASTAWGLLLLSINLLFDGLTNSTQDHINAAFKPYSGSQMMCAQNILSTALTTGYLLLLPRLPAHLVPFVAPSTAAPEDELSAAVAFLSRHPTALNDVVGFAACGAIGQVFIFATLARFSSLLLVTITVTRKMLTMLVSVVAFGHRLGGWQWVGVGLVFGGVGGEAWVAAREKRRREGKKVA